MRKQVSKMMALAMAALSLVSITACGKDTKKEPNQIVVYNFDGGVGTEWLYQAAKRFEEAYANTSFVDGMSGVKVSVVPGKDANQKPATSDYDVFFTESVFFNDLIATGEILDITDIVKSPLTNVLGCTETGTIENKLFDEHKEALPAMNGKYYALPHYECYSGISYDRDLFNERKLFIKEGTGETQFTNLDGNLSVGPDGIRGSYDDGLPSSYEEFYNLLDRMVKLSIEPFMYTGKYPTYTNHLVNGLWAAYAGKDEYMLNVTFNSNKGEEPVLADIITGFNADGTPIVEEKNITMETGYLMSQHASKYYALEFFETVMKDSDNFSMSISKGVSHLDAQSIYIKSALENEPIAMIIEGSYWYNEAAETLAFTANAYPETGPNRNFAFMPMPQQLTGQVQEGQGRRNAIIDTLNSYAFINAKVAESADRVEIAKAFLQFCYTDTELLNFTKVTSNFKGVQYTTDRKMFEGMSNYAKNIFDLRNSSDVIHPVASNKIFLNAQTKFNYNAISNCWESTVDNSSYKYPVSAFTAGKTAEKYFQGMWTSQATWNDSFSAYFN